MAIAWTQIRLIVTEMGRQKVQLLFLFSFQCKYQTNLWAKKKKKKAANTGRVIVFLQHNETAKQNEGFTSPNHLIPIPDASFVIPCITESQDLICYQVKNFIK